MEGLIFLLIVVPPAILILKYRDKKKSELKYRSFFYGLEDFLSPRLFGIGEKKVVEEKKPETDYIFLTKLFLVLTFTKSATFLTKYYPFSLLFQNKIFHYQYIKANRYIKDIRVKLNIYPLNIDLDNHFFYLFYKYNELKLKKFENEYNNDNIFISKTENNLIKVAIPRN